MGEALSKHVGSNLLVEGDEPGGLRWVLLLRRWSSQDFSAFLQELVRLCDLLPRPLDCVDSVDSRRQRSPGPQKTAHGHVLLPPQSKEAEFVLGPLLDGNVARDIGLVRLYVGEWRQVGAFLRCLFGRLIRLEHVLRGRLQEIRLGALELPAGLGVALKQIRQVAHVAEPRMNQWRSVVKAETESHRANQTLLTPPGSALQRLSRDRKSVV